MSFNDLGWMIVGMLAMAVAGLPVAWYFADRRMGQLRDSLGRERRDLRMAEAMRQAQARPETPLSRPAEGQSILPPGPWMPITWAEREKYRQ